MCCCDQPVCIGEWTKMIVKVILGTMQNARKLVSIAESIPCDVELCYGRYVVNAKSMLGVLSMPEFDGGELHIHTDNEKECEKILFQLLDFLFMRNPETLFLIDDQKPQIFKL